MTNRISRSKWCTDCGLRRLRSSFSADTRRRDGLRAVCKLCVARAYRRVKARKERARVKAIKEAITFRREISAISFSDRDL